MAIPEDRYISGKTIHDYLVSFAEDHDLISRIQLKTSVSNAQKKDDHWALTLSKENAISQISGSKLIVASGVTSGVYLPDFPKSGFNKPILHSSQIGPQMNSIVGPSVERAVVLGAAKSAYDTVFLLLQAGKKVDWIIREDGSGVRSSIFQYYCAITHSVIAFGYHASQTCRPCQYCGCYGHKSTSFLQSCNLEHLGHLV